MAVLRDLRNKQTYTEPITIPIKSAIDNQTYSLNPTASMFVESIFIAQIKNANDTIDVPNRYLDSLVRESPNDNMAKPPANDKQVREISKFGKNISQYRLISPELITGVISHQCINENQMMPIKNNAKPKFLSLILSLPTGTLPEYAILNNPIKIIIVGPAIKPNK